MAVVVTLSDLPAFVVFCFVTPFSGRSRTKFRFFARRSVALCVRCIPSRSKCPSLIVPSVKWKAGSLLMNVSDPPEHRLRRPAFTAPIVYLSRGVVSWAYAGHGTGSGDALHLLY